MKKFIIIFPLVIVAVSFLTGLYFSPFLPDLMASHWGINGKVNGYVSKNFGVYFMPVLSLFLYFLFRFLPKIDPYKKNFKEFENYFNNFICIVFSFLFYIYLLTLFWNLGYRFDMIQLMSPALAVIFYYAGVLTQNARQNWFVGIRTPWTLSSKTVWQKTHKLGGKLFKITGGLSLLGVVLPQYAIYLTLIPVLITAITVFVYSYLLYSSPSFFGHA
jgi:uncharacterized membrane protein